MTNQHSPSITSTNSVSEPDQASINPTLPKAILLAALSLTGVQATVVSPAHAEDAPDKAEIAMKYLRYRESQPGLERVGVNSPSVSLTLPFAGAWSLDSSLVSDQVSGASPRYHSAISSASKMTDSRRAGDIKLSRYFERVKISAGTSYSTEHDYDSKAFSLGASFSSEDNNTTWSVGLGRANDSIHAPTRNVKDTKHSNDFLLGLSQVLTPLDVVQLTVTRTNGNGYFSDPYKSLDIRPRERQQTAWLAQHNHYFKEVDAALRTQYRYYSDSFGIRSHTLGIEYAQSYGQDWTITPSLRLYSQTAANFYFDPVYSLLYIPKAYEIGVTPFVTEDQRLSAFGGRSFGLKLSKKLDQDWSIDASVERYQQRSDWTFFKNDRPPLANLNATILQIGVSHRF